MKIHDLGSLQGGGLHHFWVFVYLTCLRELHVPFELPNTLQVFVQCSIIHCIIMRIVHCIIISNTPLWSVWVVSQWTAVTHTYWVCVRVVYKHSAMLTGCVCMQASKRWVGPLVCNNNFAKNYFPTRTKKNPKKKQKNKMLSSLQANITSWAVCGTCM